MSEQVVYEYPSTPRGDGQRVRIRRDENGKLEVESSAEKHVLLDAVVDLCNQVCAPKVWEAR